MGRKEIDLTGRRFGRLEVIGPQRAGQSGGALRWLCRCQCGTLCTAQGRFLRSGEVQSCGCLPRGPAPGTSRKRWMDSGSGSLSRLRPDPSNPWQNLANAIVCVAADDYRDALERRDRAALRELDAFFRSGWCRVLTRLDPAVLSGRLRAEGRRNLRPAGQAGKPHPTGQ